MTKCIDDARLTVQDLGDDVVSAVNTHVDWASGCVPVMVDEDYDTHLMLTYCHRLCNDNFRDPMDLTLVIVGERRALKVELTLDYNDSKRLSMRELLGPQKLRGTCFAYTRPAGRPEGFMVGDRRLAPVFYAFYKSDRIGRLDCVHSSPSRSSYLRDRIFWIPTEDAKVTAIACAPLDAYENKPSTLTYTFGLKAAEGDWQYVTRRFPFQPSVWVDLGELLGVKFMAGQPYMYSIEGPKGKGWLMTETSDDFNLHHL